MSGHFSNLNNPFARYTNFCTPKNKDFLERKSRILSFFLVRQEIRGLCRKKGKSLHFLIELTLEVEIRYTYYKYQILNIKKKIDHF